MVALVQAAPKQISVQPGWKDFTPEGWISLKFLTRVGFLKERSHQGWISLRFHIRGVDFSEKDVPPGVDFSHLMGPSPWVEVYVSQRLRNHTKVNMDCL